MNSVRRVAVAIGAVVASGTLVACRTPRGVGCGCKVDLRDAESVRNARFGMEVSQERRTKTTMAAIAGFRLLVETVETDLLTVCVDMAKELGAKDDELASEPSPGPGKRVAKACGVAAERLAKARAEVDGAIEIDVEPPSCSVSMSELSACVTECVAPRRAGDAHCAGEVRGTCAGECRGTCDGRTALVCKGECSACAIPMTELRCHGWVHAFRVTAECKADCDAQVALRASCTPAMVKARGGDRRRHAYVAAVETFFPRILRVKVGLRGLLVGLEREVAASTEEMGAVHKALGGAGLGSLGSCAAGAEKMRIDGAVALANVLAQLPDLPGAP